MPASEETHYGVLGVPETATDEEIRLAYRRRVLELHPDKRATGAQADAGAFSAVQAAFEALRDPACRRQYDRELRERQAALEVPVSEDVDLDDMMERKDDDCYTWPCRCGDSFCLPASALSEHSGEVLVQCSCCSLFIRVLYTVGPPGT